MTSIPGLEISLHQREEPPGLGDHVPSPLEATLRPDETAAWAAQACPDPAMIGALAAIPLEMLSAAGQIDAVAAVARHKAWVAAYEGRLLGRIAATRADAGGKSYVHEEIAAAVGVSPLTAGARMNSARALLRHPRLLATLEAGRVTESQVRAFLSETEHLDATTARAVEDGVLDRLGGRASTGTVGDFRKAVRRIVLSIDPRGSAERHLDARGQRTVEWHALPDGMEGMWTCQPAEISAGIRARVTAELAKIPAADPRTADQRRADVLANLILNGPGDRVPLPSRHGLKPAVQVTVALSTLLDLDERPGELAGYGPIPAALARAIAGDESGTWRRIVCDERGELVDYGRSTYRPPAPLARHVIGRDVTCCFPHCGRPAATCELDHTDEWHDGGETNEGNLIALCARHHHLRHETSWTYRRDHDGAITWTSPTGHVYVREPQTYPAGLYERPRCAREPGQPAAPPLPDDPPF